MEPVTLGLGLAVIGLVVYAIGIQETAAGVSTAGGKVKSGVDRGKMEVAGGLGAGLVFGDQLIQLAMSEPFGVLAALAGVAGASRLSRRSPLPSTPLRTIALTSSRAARRSCSQSSTATSSKPDPIWWVVI